MLGFLAAGAGGAGRRALYECASGRRPLPLARSRLRGAQRARASPATCTRTPPPASDDRAGVPLPRRGGPLRLRRSRAARARSPRPCSATPSARGDLLNRAYNPGDGHALGHRRADPARLVLRAPLGYALTRDGGDRRGRSTGCLNGTADQFLSLDPGCEGRTGAGRRGLALHRRRRPAWRRRAVYRCNTGVGHFASARPRPARATRREGLLGYARADSPEPPPPPPPRAAATAVPHTR